MAFVSEECPFFENNSTRDEMFKPTSYYGDSDISKNCHGLWTDECKVQVLGHGGNTGGCSSMLKFDPESGIGLVIMTNEPGETMFNYGIPNLIFGKISDRPEFNNIELEDENDISGIYLSKRNIDTGAVCFQKYIGGLFPWQKNEEGSYDMELLGQNMNPEAKLYKVAEHQYIMDNNGMLVFLSVLAAILGAASLVNGIVLSVKTVKAKDIKKRTMINRYIWGVLSIVYLVFIVTFKFYNFWTL